MSDSVGTNDNIFWIYNREIKLEPGGLQFRVLHDSEHYWTQIKLDQILELSQMKLVKDVKGSFDFPDYFDDYC